MSATIRRSDGTTSTVEPRWVAGCDGAHSAVRRQNEIAFRGAPYEHVFFVADVRGQGPMEASSFNVFLWGTGFHLFLPLRGEDHWRVVGILPPELRERKDLDFEAVLPSLRKEIGPDFSFQECHWFSPYRVHHRRAERFRIGRCFLLGDAAHIHSPVGAQGMNTGLQDAYNLGWKLALVASGRADDSLLDTYDSERVPVADRLLETTDRAFTPRAGDRFPWLRVRFAPGGPVEDLFTKLDDTRFTLLSFGPPARGAVADEPANLLRTIHVPDDPENRAELGRVGVPMPSAYLLRPDGHVGLGGAAIDERALATYFSTRVGLRRQD